MKTKLPQITQIDYVKICRKISRDEEIKLHGKPVSTRPTIHKSKKQYNRMRDRKIPYFFIKVFINFCYIYTYKYN